MGYAKFLKWVGEQALKNKVLQPYLNKAWREAEKLGRPIIEKNFPGILKKAQDFYKNFKTFEPNIVKPKIQTTRGLGDLWPRQLEKILKTGKYTKVPTPKGLKPPSLKKSNVIPFPKKPLGKAEGGIAELLGEPRSGYQDGKEAKKKGPWYLWPYKRGKEWDKILEKLFKDKERNPEDYIIDAAEGGRIGFGEGDTPSEAYLRDMFMIIPGGDQLGSMSFEEWKNSASGQHYKDKWIAEHRPKLNDGGPVSDEEEYELYKQEKEGAGEEYMDFDMWKQFQLFDWGKAEGGRIGFQDGRGIMSRVGDMVDVRNVPYYAGEGLKGLVNSAETLSKFPFAAGKLGSDLLRKKNYKEMFREAGENITPGSWSENLGLTSLVEGMGEKRPEDAQTVGNLLGLGTEVAVPTGGAFKAGQFLLNKASKAMGKVKDGKTLEKLVDQKLTDSGQSRRDFNTMVATSGLMVALKSIGLGGLLKAGAKKDIGIKFKKHFVNDDVDYGTSGLMNFDLVGKTQAGKEFLKKFLNLKKGVSSFDDLEPAMVKKILEEAKKNKLSTSVDDLIEEGVSKVKGGVPDPTYYARPNWSHKILGPGKEMFKKFKKRFNKQTTKENIDEFVQEGNWHYENDKWRNLDNLPGNTKLWTDPRPRSEIKDIIDIIEPIVKKAEGGRIGLGAGGPPLQFGIAEAEWKAKHPVQGTKVSQLKDAAMDRVLPGTGLRGSANMGNFEAFYNQPLIDPMNMFEKSENPQYGLQYEKGPFEAGIGVMPSGETEYGARFKKNIDFNKMLGVHNRRQQADGGLTKTIPPERGPDPQGLPSALYNGIMRPRSY